MATNRFQVSDQLATIARFNPGIELSDDDVKKISADQLILVGRGSIVPVGPGILVNPGGGGPIRKGCIDWMFYGSSSDDLGRIRIDGVSYGPANLKDFRDILEQAAFNDKCINFCFDRTNNKMRMLNVYPQCCCRCEEVQQ